MKLFKNHNRRVEKIKTFTGKNKVFVITLIIAAIFMLYNFVFVSVDSRHEANKEVTISDTSEQDNEIAAAVESETVQDRWRFYFIDLIILGAGSGGCLIMILRQRKKTKERLK